MRVLVGKTFGIGNAVLSIPMIKAIASLGHEVDVLVGTGPDDLGALDVFRAWRDSAEDPPFRNIWRDDIAFDRPGYDRAVMAIPYDGRWDLQAKFFSGDRVMDSRRRPGNVDRLGFDMWEKHEVEYQMENARELGYAGPTPDCGFMPARVRDPDLVYVGLGYKRDPGGFGLSKHFGNERYLELLLEIRKRRPQVKFVSTGTLRDMNETWYQIIKRIGPEYSSFYRFPMLDLTHSMELVGECGAYLGNDTGMMHVAASFSIPTFGLFAYPGLLVKNPPFCDRSRGLLFTPDGPSIEEIARDFVSFVWG